MYNKITHDVCLYPYHSNFQYFTEAINKADDCFPKRGKKLLEQLCCGISSCNNCDIHIINYVNLKSPKQWGEKEDRPKLTILKRPMKI